jgi:beta propeller repeat protein
MCLITLISVASAAYEIRLTQNGAKASNPAIYGDIVVWSDSSSGSGVIHLYNLTTGKDTKLNSSSATYPAIYGNKVVWLDNSGNPKFCVYDIRTSSMYKITKNVTSYSIPAICGNRIVWNDSGRVYLYDICSFTQTYVTNCTLGCIPDIYNDRIVYDDDREVGHKIFMYNASIHNDTEAISCYNDGDTPKIYNNKIIWGDSNIGEGDMNMYDITKGEYTDITSDHLSGGACDIFGDKIVYIKNRDFDFYHWEIYVYDLSTHRETRISTSGFADNPAIYGDKIVWADSRNDDGSGNFCDIYIYDISAKPAKPQAAFTAKMITGKAPLKVTFTDKSTGSPNSWSWNFGDKCTSTVKNPTHKYSKSGKYTVRLTVKNAAGSNSVTKSGYITVK